MSIRLHRSFEVRRPVAAVWAFLTDPHCIASCMPGAHLLDIVDGTLVGEVDLSLGPFGTKLAGEAGFREVDDADWEPTTYHAISEWGHHPPELAFARQLER